MKFKVGDKVRLVRMDDESEAYKKYLGNTYTIDSIEELKSGECANLKEIASISPYLKNLELVKDKYTYEDLKKAPIGTKVTFENGEKLIKCSVKRYENENRWRDEKDFVRMEDKFKTLGKITKIEEPTYQTVYEAKKEILDEAEKRYLRGVVRPYKDVKSIQKYIFFDKKLAKIQIFVLDIRGTGCWSIDLPPFEKNAMYKNMEDNKDYTLEELGL